MTESRPRYRTRRRPDPMAEWLGEKLEKDFQTELLDLAHKLGYRHYHTRDARRSPEGFPDLVLVKPPRVIFAELKREAGQPSVDQLVWYGLLSQCGGCEAYIWRPRDFDRIIEILQGR